MLPEEYNQKHGASLCVGSAASTWRRGTRERFESGDRGFAIGAGDQDMADGRRVSHGLDDLFVERAADDDGAGARVLQDVLVVGCRPARIQRHRHGANLDCAKKRVDELRAVEHQQQHALLGADTQLLEHRPDAVDLVVQLLIRNAAIAALDRYGGATAFVEMAVDEVTGGVERS